MKKVIIIICIAIILVGAVVIYQHIVRQREMAIEQEQIRVAYLRLNHAFSWDSYWLGWLDWDSMEEYSPLAQTKYNSFGILSESKAGFHGN